MADIQDTDLFLVNRPAADETYKVTFEDIQDNIVTGVAVGDNPPADPANGALWFDTKSASLFVWYDDPTTEQWVDAYAGAVSGGGAQVAITTTAPSGPDEGDLWWNPVKGEMYIYYVESGGGSAQWVAVSPGGVYDGSGGGGGGFPDAPIDADTYGRHAAGWEKVLPLSGGAITGNLELVGEPDGTTALFVNVGASFLVVGKEYILADISTTPSADWARIGCDIFTVPVGGRFICIASVNLTGAGTVYEGASGGDLTVGGDVQSSNYSVTNGGAFKTYTSDNTDINWGGVKSAKFLARGGSNAEGAQGFTCTQMTAGTDNQLIGFLAANADNRAAVTNYGFRSDYDETGTNGAVSTNYNFYAAGNAPNWFVGRTIHEGGTSVTGPVRNEFYVDIIGQSSSSPVIHLESSIHQLDLQLTNDGKGALKTIGPFDLNLSTSNTGRWTIGGVGGQFLNANSNDQERIMLTQSGNIHVGHDGSKIPGQDSSNLVDGASIFSSGLISSCRQGTEDEAMAALFSRNGDGTLVSFRDNGTEQGNIKIEAGGSLLNVDYIKAREQITSDGVINCKVELRVQSDYSLGNNFPGVGNNIEGFRVNGDGGAGFSMNHANEVDPVVHLNRSNFNGPLLAFRKNGARLGELVVTDTEMRFVGSYVFEDGVDFLKNTRFGHTDVALPGVSNNNTGTTIESTSNGTTIFASRTDAAPMRLTRVGTNGDVLIFNKNGAAKGSIIIDDVTIGSPQLSDYRIKKDIVDMTGATDIVKALRPVTFEYTDRAPGVRVDGFVAHEVAEAIPATCRAVYGDKDATEAIGTYTDPDGNEETEVTEPSSIPYGATWTQTGTRDKLQGVDATKLIPVLTKALQEALEEIDTLKTRLSDAGIA